MQLHNLQTGIIYRNEIPHVKSIHAYFPSVVSLPDQSLFAMYMLGEAFEAANLQLYGSRSEDRGSNWEYQGALQPVCRDTDRIYSTFGRLTSINETGELIANLIRYDRSAYPDAGLCNPKTLGMVPCDLMLIRSQDLGLTWSRPEIITPPLEGPEFEMCSPVTVLSDGRWLWPTSTWRDWHGNLPNGNRMIALVSHDQGNSWPEYLDIMHSQQNNLIFWESKVVELPDGRLLATAWCYDEVAHSDLPNQFSISNDGGRSWSQVATTQIIGQTLTPIVLDEHQLLSIYRRIDKPGLWACLSHLSENGEWTNINQHALWGHNSAGFLTKTGENMSDNFASLKFGAPHITRLSEDELFVAFWCYEECVSVIRWFRFQIDY